MFQSMCYLHYLMLAVKFTTVSASFQSQCIDQHDLHMSGMNNTQTNELLTTSARGLASLPPQPPR